MLDPYRQVLSEASTALPVVGHRRPRCLCHDHRHYSRNCGYHCSLQPRPSPTASLHVALTPHCRRRPPPPLQSPLLLPPIVVVVAATTIALTTPPHPSPNYKVESRILAPLICCD